MNVENTNKSLARGRRGCVNLLWFQKESNRLGSQNATSCVVDVDGFAATNEMYVVLPKPPAMLLSLGGPFRKRPRQANAV